MDMYVSLRCHVTHALCKILSSTHARTYMYVCMYECMYVCFSCHHRTHSLMAYFLQCKCVYAHTWTCMYVSLRCHVTHALCWVLSSTHARTSMYVGMYVCFSCHQTHSLMAYFLQCICVYARTHEFMHIYMHIYTHTHVYIYIYIYTHTHIHNTHTHLF